MRLSRRLDRRWLPTLGVAAVALALAPLAEAAHPHQARVHGLVPPANPAANVAPSPNYDNCTASGFCTDEPPCYSASASSAPDFTSAACEAAEVAAINNARAKEGVGPMTLPSDFDSLTGDEQLLVVVDLERVGRGLPPFAGIVASLDAVAQRGTQPAGAPAGSYEDPSFPSGFRIAPGTSFAWKCGRKGGGYACRGSGEPGASIAAGGQISALDADYGWMYNDGYGGANVACKTPTSSGCWGHRDNILGRYPVRSAFGSPRFGTPIGVGRLRRTILVMGAGSLLPVGPSEVQGNWTGIFAATTGRAPQFVFTWKQALAAGAH